MKHLERALHNILLLLLLSLSVTVVFMYDILNSMLRNIAIWGGIKMADYIMIIENGKVSCVEIQYTVLNPIKKFSKFIRMEDLVKRKEEKSKQKEVGNE